MADIALVFGLGSCNFENVVALLFAIAVKACPELLTKSLILSRSCYFLPNAAKMGYLFLSGVSVVLKCRSQFDKG